MGTQPSPQKGGGAPSPIFYCAQMAGCITMPLGIKVCLSPGDFVFDGDPAPSPKRGTAPKFSAHFYCCQMAGCITMPLGTEVGLSPGDFMFDGNPGPLPKRVRSPLIFGPCLLRPNGCIHQDATWYGCRPRPRRHCVRWGPRLATRDVGQKLGALPLWGRGWVPI